MGKPPSAASPPPLLLTTETLTVAVSPETEETPTVDGMEASPPSEEASTATVTKPPWQLIGGVACTPPAWNKTPGVAKNKSLSEEDSLSEDGADVEFAGTLSLTSSPAWNKTPGVANKKSDEDSSSEATPNSPSSSDCKSTGSWIRKYSKAATETTKRKADELEAEFQKKRATKGWPSAFVALDGESDSSCG